MSTSRISDPSPSDHNSNFNRLLSEQEGQGEGIDVRAILAMLIRHKWKIVLLLLLSLLGAWFYLSRTIPLYTARSEIVVEGRQAPVDLGELLGPGGSAVDKELQNELLIIRSRPLMALVIDELDLMSDVEFNPTAGTPPQPIWTTWLARYGFWPVEIDTSQFPPKVAFGIPHKQPEIRRNEQMLRVAIDRLKSKVETGIIRGTTTLWITTSAWSPEKAALITNTIAKAYIDERVRARVQVQRDASKFIGEQVVELREEVEASEAAIQAFRSQNTIIDPNEGNVSAFENVRNRAEAAATLERSLEAKLERYERTLASGDGIRAAARVLEDSRLSALADAGFNARLQEEVDVAIAQLRTDLRLARSRAEALAKSLEETEASLQAGGRNLVRLRQLEREAEASKLLFETFLARQKETAAQQQLISADVRVLNPAQPPYKRSSPNSLYHYLAALGIGALLTGALIFLLEQSRNRFVTAEELEAWSGYTVLGTIPKFIKLRRRSQILNRVQREPGGSLAEAVRNLRTSILLANVDTPPKVVVLTSSVPEEGKSLTSILLATVTAQMGAKALIIDADLRRRTLHHTLRKKPEPGLIALLNGSATFDEAVRVDDKNGLHAILVERNKASAPDLLSSAAFKKFLDDARERYDLVILDAPPVLPVTDARILGKMADALVYVVKWNDTPKGVVKNGMESLSNLGIHISGLVFAQVDRKKQREYGYGHYGYGSYKYYKKASSYYTDN